MTQSEVPPSKSSVSAEDASSSGPALQRREIQPTDADVQSVQSLPQSAADTKSEDAAVVAIGSVALLSQLQMTSKLMELFQMTLWCNRCNRKPG